MELPRVRFTLRAMMGGVALASFAWCLCVEIPKVWERWRFCRERAELFAECASNCRKNWRRSIAQLERTERVIRNLKALGPERRSIASLAGLAGDPDGDRFWSKKFVQYAKQTEGDLGLQHDWGQNSISPLACAEWYSWLPQAQRDDVQRRADWTAAYNQMARAYRRAQTRPWEAVPRETIKP
jgi:hypothetical protein